MRCTASRPSRPGKTYHRPGPAACAVRRGFRDDEDAQHEAHGGDWDIDQEHGLPVNVLHGPTADEEPDGGANPCHGRPDTNRARAFRFRKT